VAQFGIAEGRLPSGLAIAHENSSNTAELRGTPQEAGMFEFTIRAWCYGTNVSGQVGQQAYTLVVK
jgi:hypothetical protein